MNLGNTRGMLKVRMVMEVFRVALLLQDHLAGAIVGSIRIITNFIQTGGEIPTPEHQYQRDALPAMLFPGLLNCAKQ